MKLASSRELCGGNGILLQLTLPSRMFLTMGPSLFRPTVADMGS